MKAIVISCISCLLIFSPLNVIRAAETTAEVTTVTSVLDAVIDKNKNIVYCPTFQIAWNEMCNNVIGEELRLDEMPEYAKKMNKLSHEKIDIDENSCISMAGAKKDNIIDKIKLILKKKFNDTEAIDNCMQALPDTLLKHPEDILIFAYLYKSLSFVHVFDDIGYIHFRSNNNDETFVKGFGINDRSGTDSVNLRSQINIKYDFVLNVLFEILKESEPKDKFDDLFIDGKNPPEGFIIVLNTSSDDELYLSTLPVENTLLETYNKISYYSSLEDFSSLFNQKYKTEKIKSLISRVFVNIDTTHRLRSLKIPILNVDVFHSYNELLNKNIKNQNSSMQYISAAFQKISFFLNYRGIKLSSYAVIVKKSHVFQSWLQSRMYCIDKPFVVILKGKKSKTPYFMSYICDDTFLEKETNKSLQFYTE